MKGNPPFSRKPVALESVTSSFAGLGPALRKRHRKPLVAIGRVKVLDLDNSLWLVVPADKNLILCFRLIEESCALSTAAGRLSGGGEMTVTASGGLGTYRAVISLEDGPHPAVRIRISLRTAKTPVRIERMPPDVCLTDRNFKPLGEGYVFTKQTGPTAGQAFVAAGNTGLFYFQNLTALSLYGRMGEADLAGSVGVSWPQLGFRLPASKAALPARKEFVISDAFIRLDRCRSSSEVERALCFVDQLERVYRQLPPKDSPWFDWEEQARKCVEDLTGGNDCLRKIRGKYYLNAYVGSINKPPESMVQGSAYVPLLKYQRWFGKSLQLVRTLDHYPLSFFDSELGSMMRWLPGAKFSKAEPSEEEHRDTMDSWYLLHTLMSLGRQAEFGRDSDRVTFLKSIGYAIRVANHFSHDWPVFYHRKTLAIIKPETRRGEGGEQDVPGLYVHVMMQAWRMTHEQPYLDEAEAAAMKLRGLGFGVLYQTNNTMLAAVALGWLWAATGNSLYKEISFVCMASILSHLWMWESEHSRRTWKTFMGLPPLHDAPYIAPYEEAEVLELIHYYVEVLGKDLPPSLNALLAEYGRHLLARGHHYYLSEIPGEMHCPAPKEGFLREDLAIPVEDLYPSAALVGQIGQEVYGAGLALILTTTSYHRWPGFPFDVWTNVTATNAQFSVDDSGKSGRASFRAGGTKDYSYQVRCIPHPRTIGKLVFTVCCRDSANETAPESKSRSLKNPEGHHCCVVRGGELVSIAWELSR